MAIDLAEGRLEPAFHFDIVSETRTLVSSLRRSTRLEIHWVPAHVGVPGNESANDAAKAAACSMAITSPVPGQPLIPLAVTKSLLTKAQRERWQQRWIMTNVYSFDDGLFRLKPGVARTPAFFVGSRAEQTVLARLRLGKSKLAAHRARWDTVDRQCDCGMSEESAHHYLLECPQHSAQRRRLLTEVKSTYPGRITENILLGVGAGPSLDQRRAISTAVYGFIRDTKKEL